MSRANWDIITRSKRFYIQTFRRAGTALIFSTAINLLLLIGIQYFYFSQAENDTYSTDGVTPPVLLTAMDAPNYTSTPMLSNDPVQDDDNRVIPK